MQNWVERGKRGFAQGLTHSFARLGNAITPPCRRFPHGGCHLARLLRRCRMREPRLGARLGLVLSRRSEGPSRLTPQELAALPEPRRGPRPQIPWGPLAKRIWPVTLTYFCYGWCLAIYLSWLPLFFKKSYNLDLKQSAIFSFGVFLAGVVGDSISGIASDLVLRRTGNIRFARLSVILVGFVGALLSLCPCS